jgi:hypothetical protein
MEGSGPAPLPADKLENLPTVNITQEQVGTSQTELNITYITLDTWMSDKSNLSEIIQTKTKHVFAIAFRSEASLFSVLG